MEPIPRDLPIPHPIWVPWPRGLVGPYPWPRILERLRAVAHAPIRPPIPEKLLDAPFRPPIPEKLLDPAGVLAQIVVLGNLATDPYPNALQPSR